MPPAEQDDFSLRRFLASSKEELRIKTEMLEAKYKLSKASWSINRDKQIIKFKFSDGNTGTAAVQIIGTHDTQDEHWIWGWDNPYVDRALADHARRMLAFGKEHNVPQMIQRRFKCPEKVCWDFAALTCKFCIAAGVYRGLSNKEMVYMTFGPISVIEPAK